MNDVVAQEPAPAEDARHEVGAHAFTFGDAEPVLNRRELLDHIECWHNGRWYEPPVSLAGLARTFRASPHHSSAMIIKRQMLASTFIPHAKLSRDTFEALAFDYLIFANGYLEERTALSGRRIEMKRSPAKYTRRGLKDGQYFFIEDSAWGKAADHEFPAGKICHLLEADLNQEIYGVPGYLSALQSTFLNEAATIFRRRYYLNGSHAGFILYMTDAAQQQGDIDDLRKALKDSKGPGNFRNLFLYAPNGKKDGVQVIPVSEVAAKDEFIGIKNTSRDDILAAHRVPPQLLGMVPANAGGFGDVAKATDVFMVNEIVPLQKRFLSINEWAGEELVRFEAYEPMSKPTPAAA